MKYREDQSNFFGKRGITWHITVVSRKKKEDSNSSGMVNDPQQQNYVTISDDDQVIIENEHEEELDNLHHSKTSKIMFITDHV